jgi:hypothetical protein
MTLLFDHEMPPWIEVVFRVVIVMLVCLPRQAVADLCIVSDSVGSSASDRD